MSTDLALLAAAVVFLLGLRMWLRRGMRVRTSEAGAQVQRGDAILIDVREPSEWTGGVAGPALLLPLSDLWGARVLWKPVLEKYRDRKLLLYCRSGMRSALAGRLLRAEGFDAANAGSFDAWRDAGLPVRRP